MNFLNKFKMKLILCLMLLCGASSVFAGIGDFFEGKSGVFTLDPVYDGIIGGGGLALTGGLFIYDFFAPVHEFDGVVLNKDEVNPFDRWAMRPYSKLLHITGTVTEVLSMAAPLALIATDKSEWGIWVVMYAESVLWANGLKEALKFSVQRERPYMYFEGAPLDKIDDGDYLKSFPSGHTTMAFNGAVFASYTFSKYFPESKWKIPVIAGSLTLATATAVQRILSGNHFVTDVLTGAAIGSLTGFMVPFLHTLPKRENLEVAVAPTGFYVQYRY
jgi:undecaprenyl-diphosphatase